MSVYSDEEHDLYVEAVRCIPGMVACMDEHRNADGRTLLLGYLQAGKCMGIKPEQCWAILFTAAMHWIANLTQQIAGHVEISSLDAARQMGVLAGLWETEGCPGG